jgi:hypothetical protein
MNCLLSVFECFILLHLFLWGVKTYHVSKSASRLCTTLFDNKMLCQSDVFSLHLQPDQYSSFLYNITVNIQLMSTSNTVL